MAYFYSIKICFLLRRKNIVQINYIHEQWTYYIDIFWVFDNNNISNSNTSWVPGRLLYLLSCRSVKQIDESKYRYRQVHRGLVDYLNVNKLSFKGGGGADVWQKILNADREWRQFQMRDKTQSLTAIEIAHFSPLSCKNTMLLKYKIFHFFGKTW